MDRLTKNLVIFIAIVIASAAIIIAFYLTQSKAMMSKAQPSSTNTNVSDIALISTDTADIVSMEVTNASDHYTILPISKNANDDIGTTYTIDGMQDYKNLDNNALQTFVQYGSNPATTKNIGNVSDLSVYGLDNPAAVVKVKFADAVEYDYCVGNLISGTSSSYYICPLDTHNVYAASLQSSILETRNQFLEKSILSLSPYNYANKTNPEAPENGFSSIIIHNQNLKTPATYIKVSGNDYTLNNDPVMEPNYNTLNNIRTSLTSLSASRVALIDVTPTLLTKQGFDNPTAAVNFTVNGVSYTIKAVKQSETTWYIWLANTRIIYSVDASVIESWANSDLFTLASANLYNSSGNDDFSEIAVTRNDTTQTIQVNRVLDEAKSTETTPYYKYIATLQNGQNISDATYNTFLQTLSTTSADRDYTGDVPTDTPAISIKLTHYNTDRTDLLNFYKTDAGYIATVNGVVRGLMLEANVDALQSCLG